jgi:NAD(P)-dependent dehydrogenase (short-subunit alcohol dehydrogenase family)
MQIKGSGVIVTGASQGLGAAVARELAARGAKLVLVARRKEPLEAVAAAIRAAGGEAHPLAADVGDKEATHAIAGAAAALVGPIDLLVHAASTLGKVPLAPLLDTDCEDLARVFEVNLVGPFRLSKAVVGSMLLRDKGLVVQLTSDASVVPYARWGAYSASKAAGDQLVRVWAEELAATNVRLLSVDPGEMDTQMHADAIPDADRGALARPHVVAVRLSDLIARSDSVPTGSRIVLGAS